MKMKEEGQKRFLKMWVKNQKKLRAVKAFKEFKEAEEDLEEAVEAISSDAEEHEENSEKVKEKTGWLITKNSNLYQKIKCTIQGLCDKIKLLTEKKDKLTQFVRT